MASSPPPIVQDPSAPAPRVVYHDNVDIPKGFNCGLCRPATDGSLVYLLSRTKERSNVGPGVYTFWVFVYDWKTRRGLQLRLPEVFPWETLALSPYQLTIRIIRMAVGGRLRGQDTRSSYKTGGI